MQVAILFCSSEKHRALSSMFFFFFFPFCTPGVNCQVVVAPCSPDPCENSGICQESPDSEGYTCQCAPGWEGNVEHNVLWTLSSVGIEPFCHWHNERSYFWALRVSGERCTVDIDECLSKPCKNHALCHNIQGSYLCECRPGFTGGDCDSNIDDCLSSEYQWVILCFLLLPRNNFALLLMNTIWQMLKVPL